MPEISQWDSGGGKEERLADETTATLKDALDRFKSIQQELYEQGIHSAVVLITHDPLTEYAHKDVHRRGNVYALMGAMQEHLNETLG